MLHIAGGAYLEFCSEPIWSEFYGSGLRAAIALSKLSKGIQLSTYISKQEEANLDSIGNTFGLKLNRSPANETPEFHYYHSLSKPNVLPLITDLHPNPPITIDGEAILRFGLIEGEAVVSGKRVVYDPQSPLNPKRFDQNGSSAEHLAIVANQKEVSLLTGSTSMLEAGKKLIDFGAEVVVIKRGALGATVVTGEGNFSIPVFQIRNVFPIGSGDIFSAAFAFQWAVNEEDPLEAALFASRAAAYYCSQQVLPLPVQMNNFQASKLNIDAEKILEKHLQIYLAGPFFTTAQRWIVNETHKALRNQGLRVFSPFHDVGHGIASDVVPLDLDALKNSQTVFAILDGLDSGTLFEIGYARAVGIPVIAFIQNENSNDLKMLEGTSCLITNDFASAIYNTVWETIKR